MRDVSRRGYSAPSVTDALLLVDLVNRFDHEDAERLLASYRQATPQIVEAREHAARAGAAVIYVNDAPDRWTSDAPGLVRAAIEEGHGRNEVARVAPAAGDRFLFKPRYSGFDHTPLVLILRELGVDRIVLAGAATERCVVQTAIDGRELGFKVTILKDACAHVDEEIARIALTYAAQVVGAEVIQTRTWTAT